MRPGTVDLDRVIEEIVALPQEERRSWLDGVAEPGELLMRLGDEVERLAVVDATKALESGRAVVAVADAVGLAGPRTRTRRALAQAKAYSGRFDTALAMCREAVEIGLSGGEPIEAARARLASVHALASLGRFDEAVAAGSRARDELVAAGVIDLAARADLNLGAVFAMRDNPAAALMYLDRARPVFEKNPAILAQLETNRGNALAALNDFSGAIQAFEAAVPAFAEGGQMLAAAITEGNLGSLHAKRGQPQLALHHFERARRLLDESDAPAHRTRLLAEHAEVIASVGLATEAAESLAKIVPELDALGLKTDAAQARVVAGRAAIALGQYDAARDLLDTAAEALTDAGAGTTSLAHAERLRAALALQAGNVAEAGRLARISHELVSDRAAERAVSAVLLSRVALASEDPIAASLHVDQGLADAEALGLTPVIADLYTQLGRIRRAQGEPAVAEFERAVNETERLRGALQAEQFRSAFHSDRMAPYEELLREALNDAGPDSVALAFRASELLKNRSLLDAVGGTVNPEFEATDAESALVRRMTGVRAELNWAYSQIAAGTGDRINGARLRELEREISEIEGRLASGRSSAIDSAGVSTIADVQRTLGAADMVVSFGLNGSELVAFVIDAKSATVVRELGTLSDVVSRLQRFRLQVARAQAHRDGGDRAARFVEDARRELATLDAMLIEPVVGTVTGIARLMIAPVGPLHTLPFAALWNGSRYLAELVEISTAPSASLFVRLSERSTGELGTGYAAIGVPDALTPAIPAEISQVSHELPGVRVLLGPEATADAARDAIQGVRVAHLACHGRYSHEHPKASGLKLTDRWLTLAEISQLRLPNAHVTLSACDTGRVSVRAGDELVGLTRGFYAAGAQSLIVSLWPASDESTASLMSHLYRQYSEGLPFAAALRSAQRHAIDEGQHPAYWAPFVFGGVS